MDWWVCDARAQLPRPSGPQLPEPGRTRKSNTPALSDHWSALSRAGARLRRSCRGEAVGNDCGGDLATGGLDLSPDGKNLSPKVKTSKTLHSHNQLKDQTIREREAVTRTPTNPWSEVTEPPSSNIGADSHPSGWWKASDGNWYPPERHPHPQGVHNRSAAVDCRWSSGIDPVAGFAQGGCR
jgi:hypothetical protein